MLINWRRKTLKYIYHKNRNKNKDELLIISEEVSIKTVDTSKSNNT